MKTLIESLALNVLSRVGRFPTRLTSKEEISTIIRRLWPIVAESGLVRLGPDGDGGYLVPNDLDDLAACFSPGVSAISGFEKDCADLGMQVFLADASVDAPALHHERFTFTKKFLGVTTNREFMTLDDWVSISLPQSNSDLMLQMDIEGYEYEALLNVSSNLLRRFRIIVVEFHSLDQLWNKPFFGVASRVFERLLQTHSCVHIHPNNCHQPLNWRGLVLPYLAEFTFLRNDRIRTRSRATSFPHPLDSDNTQLAHVALPDCWHMK